MDRSQYETQSTEARGGSDGNDERGVVSVDPSACTGGLETSTSSSSRLGNQCFRGQKGATDVTSRLWERRTLERTRGMKSNGGNAYA